MGETEPERKLDPEEIAGPICVPCGGLYQIPCPCEDACEPKCSEGLISTSLLDYNYGSLIGRRLDEGAERRLLDIDHEFAVSVNLCLPCGALGQPPCPGTDCSEGLVSTSPLNYYYDSFIGRRLEEGAERRLPGHPEIALSASLCLPCGALGQPPCPGTDCLPGLVPFQDDNFSLFPTPFTVCVPCGGEGEPCCCDSSEFDEKVGFYIFTNTIPDEVKSPLLEAIIQGINADPTKCLSGCTNTDFKCGVNNICFDPTPTPAP